MRQFSISEPGNVSKTAEKITAPCLENKAILIAEDDFFTFDMMKYMLHDTRANILHANNGKKALEIIKNNPVDFVFLDIRLPVLNGYEVLAQIREYNKVLPVVAQTANVFPEDKAIIREAGFTAYITKPFSQQVLFKVLNRFIPSHPAVTPVFE